MRARAPGQSALLMAGVAESLAPQGVRYAVIGAMAAAHGVVRASLGADAIVSLHVSEAQALRQSLLGKEDFIAMKAFAGAPIDLADARAVMELDRE